MYEQEKEYDGGEENKRKEHILFWEKESRGSVSYSRLLDDIKKLDFHCHCKEMAISFGCSTVCNAKCRNCTHETMVRDGELIPRIVELKELYYWVRKYKLLSLLSDMHVTGVDPVGMGEPLTNPNIIEILKYIKIFFPDAALGLNTNISLLKGNLAREIAKIGLDYIYLSLSYYNKQIYERETGLSYDDTMNNIHAFIKICEEERTDTRILIHVLNNKLNSKKELRGFMEHFRPLLHHKDRLEIRKYIQASDKTIEGRGNRRKKLRPCYELWQVMATEADGTIYPCCLGLWKKKDPYLAIGNIADPIPRIIQNLIRLREKQFHGDFGTCVKCDVLYHNIKFFLPMFLYDKKESAHNDIHYIVSNRFALKVLRKIETKIYHMQERSTARSYPGIKED